MCESFKKCCEDMSPAPVSSAGCGDLSQRELSREQRNLHTTRGDHLPTKKQTRSPVSKFTAQNKNLTPSKNLKQIQSCLETFHTPKGTPTKPTKPPLKKIVAKAISMEDLTPTKRVRIERHVKRTQADPEAESKKQCKEAERRRSAARQICRFMVLSSLRRRREEVKCLKKTLESQVCCSERLRMQVGTLKSLLDSDNRKVLVALREMERLKRLLADKERERRVLDDEKRALEQDVLAEEDRASEMQIGWQNCRNELESTRAALAAGASALAQERVLGSGARAQRDDALYRLSLSEESLQQHARLLGEAEEVVDAMREEAAAKERLLEETIDRLELEVGKRERAEGEAAALGARVRDNSLEMGIVKRKVSELREELERLSAELRATRERLDWWPRPLARLLGAARAWLRSPAGLHEAALWTLVPARRGC